MIAYPGKIKIEDVSELKRCLHFFFTHFAKIHIVLAGNVSATGIIFPVHAPVDGNILFFRDHGFRSGDRRLFACFRRMQIIVGKGIDITVTVVVRHLWRVGIEKEIGQHVGLATITKFQFVAFPLPAAFP